MSTTAPATSGRAANAASCWLRVSISPVDPAEIRPESVRITVLYDPAGAGDGALPLSVMPAHETPVRVTWRVNG